MVIKTYFDKNNTIVYNSSVNTGLNPIAELFYGGNGTTPKYSRFLFYFDESRLQSLYTGGTFTDITKLKHTLKMTNSGSLDKSLINSYVDGFQRTSSFDLIAFTINQPWDNGVGYDYFPTLYFSTDDAYLNSASNWVNSQIGISWSGGSGVYSGSPSGITVATQHFDIGNENLSMDITEYVNGVLTGNTNYGLGIAFSPAYELMSSSISQYVSFFTNNTQTFYEPYVETTYSNHITDDRNNFYLDKPNQLYLYVNLAGNPVNLDSNPSVNVYDQNNVLFSSYTPSAVTNVTLGVYSIDITVPTNGTNDCTMYTDIWSGITISGVTRPPARLEFVMKDSNGYYNIGGDTSYPKKVGVSISGLQNQEKIKRGDIRKVIVSARIPYTVEQTQNISGLKYRLYVTEGPSELTVIDFQPIEMASNYYYFLIDTLSLIPNTYYIDVLVTSNLEVTTLKNVIQFDIINQVESRTHQ
jgi:hypothetical protein